MYALEDSEEHREKHLTSVSMEELFFLLKLHVIILVLQSQNSTNKHVNIYIFFTVPNLSVN